MRLVIASTNPAKVTALELVVPFYDILKGSVVIPIKVPSGVSEQPKSLEETVCGAVNRAKDAWQECECDLSFGIESGLVHVPYTRTGMLDLCACAIYDGKGVYIGLSPAFECPPKVMHLVHSERLDLNQAFHKAGFTEDPKIGNSDGAVGLLTKGRIDRSNYTMQAIIMAMVQIENAEMYNE